MDFTTVIAEEFPIRMNGLPPVSVQFS